MSAKKIFAILLMCVLSFPVYAVEEQSELLNPKTQQSDATSQDISSVAEPGDLSSFDENVLSTKEVTDNGLKTPSDKKLLIKKFIIAMLCVAGCSLFLYVSLSVYNRIRDGFISDDTELSEAEEPLEAPQDITEAVKTFVEKTHWNGV